MKQTRKKLLRFLQSIKKEWKRLTDDDYFNQDQKGKLVNQVIVDLMEYPVEHRYKMLDKISKGLDSRTSSELITLIKEKDDILTEVHNSLDTLRTQQDTLMQRLQV